MNKAKLLAVALSDAPLPKPWWKKVEVVWYFDWLSWGIVVEFRDHRVGGQNWISAWNGFMVQIGPWGMACRWPKVINPAQVGQEAMMAGGVDMGSPMQAGLSARTRGPGNRP